MVRPLVGRRLVGLAIPARPLWGPMVRRLVGALGPARVPMVRPLVGRRDGVRRPGGAALGFRGRRLGGMIIHLLTYLMCALSENHFVPENPPYHHYGNFPCEAIPV